MVVSVASRVARSTANVENAYGGFARCAPLGFVPPISDVRHPNVVGNGSRRPIPETFCPSGRVGFGAHRWLGRPDRRRMSGGSNDSKAGSVHVRQLGDGNVAGCWAQVGAGFRSCPV